jgi:hypothetical protein
MCPRAWATRSSGATVDKAEDEGDAGVNEDAIDGDARREASTESASLIQKSNRKL